VSANPLEGRRIGRYTVNEHLASGGMAEIFLARHEAEGGFAKELALKVLQERFVEDRRVVEMFLAEARLAAMLNHPNVVSVFDVGSENSLYYIAMEYVAGHTLTDVVRRGIEVSQPLPLDLAVYIVAETAAGLAFMHDALDPRGERFGVVHRDISPSNLIVGFSGQTKIIDFGIAVRADEDGDDSGVRPGKAAYMSPEQVRGVGIDGRSDIFSLGTILYELTVDRRLWRGPKELVMRRIVEDNAPPPTYIKRDYPPELELIVLRTLGKKPEDRYQSAGELFEDLERFLVKSGARTRNHHVAAYLQALFAPDAQVSEVGIRRAQAFLEDEREDDPNALDFDRPVTGAGRALADALRTSGPLVPAPASGPTVAAASAAAPASSPASTVFPAPVVATAPAFAPSGTPLATPPALPLAMPTPTPTPARSLPRDSRAAGASRPYVAGPKVATAAHKGPSGTPRTPGATGVRWWLVGAVLLSAVAAGIFALF